MSVEEKNELLVPSEDTGLGFEDMENQDFSAPFLVICQGMSPYINPTHTLYNPEARPGMIVNTQNGNIYTDVNVIPCRYAFRHVEWKPRNMGGGFVASYSREHTPDDIVTDPLTGRTKRKSNGNEILPTAYYLCLIVEEGFDRIIIPMYSTQLKKSRKWNSLMAGLKQGNKPVPIFGMSYILSVVQEANTKGSWYGWKIEPSVPTLSIDEDIYKLAKETHAMDNFLPERLIEAMSQTTDSDVI